MSMLWLDDRLIAADEARIDPADRGFLLADGVFETLRAERGRPIDLDEHLARMARGAGVLGLPEPPRARIAVAVAQVLAANGIAEAALRITWTRGVGPRGLAPPVEARPTLVVTASERASPPPPARATTVTLRRNEHSPLSSIKSLAYLEQVLALREAVAGGADEAILLNTAGRVACASAGNLVVRQGERLLTPPLGDGVLPGITRARLIARLGVVEASLGPADLVQAAEILVTGSLVRIRPVVTLDGRAVGLGTPGPAAERALAAL
jgi:branched-chain amino acid aminotransferase